MVKKKSTKKSKSSTRKSSTKRSKKSSKKSTQKGPEEMLGDLMDKLPPDVAAKFKNSNREFLIGCKLLVEGVVDMVIEQQEKSDKKR